MEVNLSSGGWVRVNLSMILVELAMRSSQFSSSLVRMPFRMIRCSYRTIRLGESAFNPRQQANFSASSWFINEMALKLTPSAFPYAPLLIFQTYNSKFAMDEQKLHREKWRIWNEQRQKEQMKKKMAAQDGIESYAANIIQKISDPVSRSHATHTKQLSNKMNSEIQSNVCSICLQLMLPPHRQPMILFPCGHNLCKDCLFEDPPKGQIKMRLKLKLDKCSLCRQEIESYALNQSLMALICTYSNNKQLLEKQRQRMQEAEQGEVKDINYEELKIRCNLLQDEQLAVDREVEKYTKTKVVLEEVIQTLIFQKKKNERQMEKLEQQTKLITKCLSEKIQQMQLFEKKLKQIHDKTKVVEMALFPLKKQKEKQQLLQIARMLEKK